MVMESGSQTWSELALRTPSSQSSGQAGVRTVISFMLHTARFPHFHLESVIDELEKSVFDSIWHHLHICLGQFHERNPFNKRNYKEWADDQHLSKYSLHQFASTHTGDVCISGHVQGCSISILLSWTPCIQKFQALLEENPCTEDVWGLL